MVTLPFKFIWLGQTICSYEVPLDIFNVLNGVYETNFVNLPDAHKQLVGKIGKENSLFFGGADNRAPNFSRVPSLALYSKYFR